MAFVQTDRYEGIVTLTLNRGKVHALNAVLVEELGTQLRKAETDPEVKAILLKGAGKFFSFGFDIPESLLLSESEFEQFLVKFTDLYTYLFIYPKPVVAALNGHAIAGGCMLALTCDYRIMVDGNAKLSLNEIGFGSSVFAGSTEMLRFWVGSARASEILTSGAMYSAPEALRLGLVHEVRTEGELMNAAMSVALDLASRQQPAFRSIKMLLRKPVAKDMLRRERASIKEFIEIWYSGNTWANLKNIKIR